MSKPKHSPEEDLARNLFEYYYPYHPPWPFASYRSSKPIVRDRNASNTRPIKSREEPKSPKESIWLLPVETNYRRLPSRSSASSQVEELHSNSLVVDQQIQQVEQVDW